MATRTDLRSALMTLEKQYWHAIMKQDAAAAASLSHDPCVVVGAQGIMGPARRQMALRAPHGKAWPAIRSAGADRRTSATRRSPAAIWGGRPRRPVWWHLAR